MLRWFDRWLERPWWVGTTSVLVGMVIAGLLALMMYLGATGALDQPSSGYEPTGNGTGVCANFGRC